MKTETVSLELSIEQLEWLEKIWSARVRICENILTRLEESNYPPDFHKNLDTDKAILTEIERVMKNET